MKLPILSAILSKKAPAKANGGDISKYGQYTVHTFKSNANFVVNVWR